jgi:hypothetical protein
MKPDNFIPDEQHIANLQIYNNKEMRDEYYKLDQKDIDLIANALNIFALNIFNFEDTRVILNIEDMRRVDQLKKVFNNNE